MFKPEDEYKEHQETEEDGDIIHGSQHDNQGSLEVGQEPHHLDDPQQSEGSEDAKAQPSLSDAVVIFIEQFNPSFLEFKSKNIFIKLSVP